MLAEWRPHQESNLDLSLRRALFYPLNYRDEVGIITSLPRYVNYRPVNMGLFADYLYVVVSWCTAHAV